jgi:hypothetical protein
MDHKINLAIDDVLKKFRQLGGTDKVAKGSELVARLLDDLADRFPEKSKAAKAG